MDLGRMILAALMMSSMVTLPLCLMFFTFFRSLGGSFSAFITSAAAEGTTVTYDTKSSFNFGSHLTAVFRNGTGLNAVPDPAV
jgi:hypothetical protein